jgi:hypothetical protein
VRIDRRAHDARDVVRGRSAQLVDRSEDHLALARLQSWELMQQRVEPPHHRARCARARVHLEQRAVLSRRELDPAPPQQAP